MATILLILIYIAFIGLGIPDSLFGASWPAIYQEWNLPISWANSVTTLISFGTVLSSFAAPQILRKYGTGKVTAISTGMTAAALLGFRLAPGIGWMCLCALPLGLGAGAIDIGLNNFVALHYPANHMNYLHSFYGIGITLTPYLLSAVMGAGAGWRGGYTVIVLIQAFITLLTVLALPLWLKTDEQEHPEEQKPQSLFTTVKDRRVVLYSMIVAGSCAIEFLCGVWGSTYLVEHKGLSSVSGAALVTCYYVGITLGRVFSGMLTAGLKPRKIVLYGQFIVAAAVVILLIPGTPAYISAAGLLLIGLGNGPLYPNIVHMVPEYFGVERSDSVISTVLAFGYVSMTVAPLIFGYIAQYISVALFAPSIALWLGVMAVCAYRFRKVK